MKIQPVTIWNNGENKIATQIAASIVSDDLATNAVFYYELLTQNNAKIVGGNVSIKGTDYSNWNGSNDSAYTYITSQLNLTLTN